MGVDITTKGALTHSELLEENNASFLGAEVLDIEPQIAPLTGVLSPGQIKATPYRGAAFSPTDEQSPLLQSGQGYWGESMWDSDSANDYEFLHLTDARALNLWGVALLAAGAGKMLTTGITTFLNGTLGTIYGIGKGIVNMADDDENTSFILGLWDNDFNRAMSQIQEDMEKVMPNYYSEAELQSPWYTNILSANFWGDKVLKNTGFTLGAAAAMWATGVAGGFGEWAASSAGRLIAGLARTSGAGLNTMKNIMTTANTVGKVVGYAVNTALSANSEASIEAINAVKENTEEAMLNLENTKKSLIQELDPMDPDFLTKYNQIESACESYKLDITSQARDVGNLVWGANMAILSVSNSLEFGHILKGGYKQSLKLLKPHFQVAGKDATFGEALTGVMKGESVLAINDVNKGLGRKLLHTGKNIISEGGEEASQNIASNTAQIQNLALLNEKAAQYKYDNGDTIFGRRINPGVTQELTSRVKALTLVLSDLFGSLEKGGWEEAFLGGLTGGAGFMSVSRKQVKNKDGELEYGPDGKPKTKWGFVWEGGFAEASRDIENEYNDNQRLVDAINKRFESPEFRKRLLHTVAQMDIDEQMNEALEKGDLFDFKNSEIGQLAEDYFFFKDAGLVDSLKDKWKAFKDIDDKTLSLIYLASLDEEGKTELTKDEIEAVRLRYQDKAESNLLKIAMMLDAYEYVDARFPKYSDDFKYELAYLYIKYADAKHRLQDMVNSKKGDNNSKSFMKELDYYLKTPIELIMKLRELDREFAADTGATLRDEIFSDLELVDIDKLLRRIKETWGTIKAYEKEPELLGKKLFQVRMAAARAEMGRDLDGLTKRIKEAQSLNDINLAFELVQEDKLEELWNRAWETGDDEVRAKMFEWNETLHAQNSIFANWKLAGLSDEELAAFARYIVGAFRENNHKSDALREAFEAELAALAKGDVENSKLLQSMGWDPQSADGISAIDKAISVLENGIERLKLAEAKYGLWVLSEEARKANEKLKRELEQLLQQLEGEGNSEDDEDASDSGSDDDALDEEEEVVPPGLAEEGVRKPQIAVTTTYLEDHSLSFREAADLDPTDSKSLWAKIAGDGKDGHKKGAATELLELTPNWNFEDIDKMVYTLSNISEKGHNKKPTLDDKIKLIKCITSYIRREDKSLSDSVFRKAVRDVVDNYTGKAYELDELNDDGSFPTAEKRVALSAPPKPDTSAMSGLLAAPKEEEEIPIPPIVEDLMDEVQKTAYKKAVQTVGANMTPTEQLQLANDIKTVADKKAKGEKIPENLMSVAQFLDDTSVSTAPLAPATDATPTLTISDKEMNAECNLGFDVEALKENNRWKLVTNEQRLDDLKRIYGTLENWRRTQFTIDNYLRDLKKSPVKFVCTTNGYVKGKPFYKAILTAVKFEGAIVDKVNKDGNNDNVWVINTDDGQYLVIGSIGYQKSDLERRAFFKDVVEHDLDPTHLLELMSRGIEWHVSKMETKIVNIGDGRMVDAFDDEAKSSRNLLDLLASKNSNPRNLLLLDLIFSIYYDDGHHYTNDADITIHSNTVQDDRSKGRVYVYLPTASGEYYRHELEVSTFNDIPKESPLMDKIKELLNNVLIKKDWNSVLLLQGFLYTENGLYFDFNSATPHVAWGQRSTSRQFKELTGTVEELILFILDEVLPTLNPRVQLTLSLLKDANHLKLLAESGCLNTLSARVLGTMGANYSISMRPGEDVLPTVPHTSQRSALDSKNFIVGGQMYTVQGDSITDKKGNPISAATLELFKYILQCDSGSVLSNTLILKKLKKETPLPGQYYFIPKGNGHIIIHKDDHGNWKEITKGKRDLVKLWKDQRVEAAQKEAETKAAHLPLPPTIDNLEDSVQDEVSSLDKRQVATTLLSMINDIDSLFVESALLTIDNGYGSTSALQRKFALGYNRAGRIMDQLEAVGIVGEYNGSNPRVVKVTPLELEEILSILNDLKNAPVEDDEDAFDEPLNPVPPSSNGPLVQPAESGSKLGPDSDLKGVDYDEEEDPDLDFENIPDPKAVANGFEKLTNELVKTFHNILTLENTRLKNAKGEGLGAAEARDFIADYIETYFPSFTISKEDMLHLVSTWKSQTILNSDTKSDLTVELITGEKVNPNRKGHKELVKVSEDLIGLASMLNNDTLTDDQEEEVHNTIIASFLLLNDLILRGAEATTREKELLAFLEKLLLEERYKVITSLDGTKAVEKEEEEPEQTKDLVEYWKNPNNFTDKLKKEIAEEWDKDYELAALYKNDFIDIREFVEGLGGSRAKASALLYMIEEYSKASDNPLFPKFTQSTAGQWFKKGDVLTLNNYDAEGNVTDTYKVTVQKVHSNGGIEVEGGVSYTPKAVKRFFGIEVGSTLGAYSEIASNSRLGEKKKGPTLLPIAKDAPTRSWDSLIRGASEKTYGNVEYYTGDFILTTLGVIEEAAKRGILPSHILAATSPGGGKMMMKSLWNEAVSTLLRLGFNSPRELAELNINNLKNEIKAREVMAQSLEQAEKRNLAMQVLENRIAPHILELATAYQESGLAAPIGDEITTVQYFLLTQMVDNTISIEDWSAFAASQRGRELAELVLKKSEELWQSAMQRLQLEEEDKKKPLNPSTKPVIVLTGSENYSTFEDLLYDDTQPYWSLLAGALTPELTKLGVTDMDELDVDTTCEALRERGISEEQYLNVRSKELFDILMEIIKDCR